VIYHIAATADWERAKEAGEYPADSLETQGFIHCSGRDQVVRVANALFRGVSNLTLLRIDPAKLTSPVVYENTSGGAEPYPHVYGPINLEAVVQVYPFQPGPEGNFDHHRIVLALSEFDCIETRRLLLRPYRSSDATRIQKLAGHREVAKTVSALPHPYEDGMAEAWIDVALDGLVKGRRLHLAVVVKPEFVHETATPEDLAEVGDDGLFIGSIGLEIHHLANSAEVGYWIGYPYWNRGYATEAAAALVKYGFEALGLNRIQACHMEHNPASGRVLQKIGMTYEGTLRQATFRFGEYHDLLMYSILRSEYEERLRNENLYAVPRSRDE